jgi:hypothetical protein
LYIGRINTKDTAKARQEEFYFPTFPKPRTLAASKCDTLLMQKIILIFAFLFLFGCKDTVKQKQTAVVIDTAYNHLANRDTLTDKNRELQQKASDEQEKSDSLRLLKALTSALLYAEQNKNKKSFLHEFELLPDDTSFNVTAQLVFGNLFENDRKHLLIRRIVPWGAVLNVYLLQNSSFKPLVERAQFGMTYVNDTLRDANGDKYNDFLVHWYPSSGCCLADVYNVYLYQPQTGRFTTDYEFINPTFSPDEKVIRGLEYGHPGEAGLYKYKWNGLRVDTIEFMYPYFNQKGKFIKTKRRAFKPNEKQGTVVNSLPNEYKKMDSIAVSWFLDTY